MVAYVVMQPTGKDRSGGPALPTVVRDGFSWAALIFGPLWLAWHRAWLAAAGTLAAFVLLNSAGPHFGSATAASLLSVLVSLYIGLEGSAFRLASLRRRGFADAGVVLADNRDDAELRFAAALGDQGAERSHRQAPLHLSIRKPLPPDPTLGRLTYPDEG